MCAGRVEAEAMGGGEIEGVGWVVCHQGGGAVGRSGSAREGSSGEGVQRASNYH